MILRIWIGPDLEKRLDKRERTMVDRVLKARPDREWHRSIWHNLGIVYSRSKCGEIARSKGRIQFFELLVLCAAFSF
jgi:hypothetical protein